jgi:hypothetical protein
MPFAAATATSNSTRGAPDMSMLAGIVYALCVCARCNVITHAATAHNTPQREHAAAEARQVVHAARATATLQFRHESVNNTRVSDVHARVCRQHTFG